MKKTITLLMAFCLFLSSALAQGSVTVSVFAIENAARGQATFAWDDAFFSGDAHAYHHDLCRLSLGMAMAAFRLGDEAPDKNIREFFCALEFSDPAIAEFSIKQSDTIGSAIAHKMIQENGHSFPLVAIAISGGNYGPEWLSNFDVGNGDQHRGFSLSAQKVVERVNIYLQENGLQNPRFWISGYSRSAAVGNLTAAMLSEQGLASDEQIFAYTFATPRTVRGEKARQHANIFNIVNSADLVPQVPLAAWNYSWYGRTLYLPSSLCEGMDYEGMLPEFSAVYESLTGSKPNAAGDSAFASMAADAARGMAMSVPTPEKYAAHYRIILDKAYQGLEMTGAEQVLLVTLAMNMANSALKGTGVRITMMDDLKTAFDSLSGLAPILYQHDPAIYLSWLLALPEGEALLDNSLTLTEASVI